MSATPVSDPFLKTNEHALDMIMESSEKHEIVASEDIYDQNNVKLWASGQPVNRQLQQRLLERKLKRPLESCLRAQDGVGVIDLLNDVDAMFAGTDALANAFRGHAQAVAREIPQLQLHPVAQLMLTAARDSQSAAYQHAIRGMVLAGAIAVATNPSDLYFVRLSLLGGLLHDIGEMYVNPAYLQAGQKLGVDEYRHVVAHPRIGQSLLASQTDYPPDLVRAIGEHHERNDGTGYPAHKKRDTLSPLGQLLCVVETTLGITGSQETPMARASFAMRLIPGEYEGKWVGVIATAAQNAQEDLGAGGGGDPQGLLKLGQALTACMAIAAKLAEPGRTEQVQKVAAKALLLLSRLRAGWVGTGMWSTGGDEGDVSDEQRFEQRMALRELRYRMRYIQRECLWPVRNLDAADVRTLTPLWEALSAA